MREHGSLQGYPTLRDTSKKRRRQKKVGADERQTYACAEKTKKPPPSYLSQVFKRFLLANFCLFSFSLCNGKKKKKKKKEEIVEFIRKQTEVFTKKEKDVSRADNEGFKRVFLFFLLLPRASSSS